MNKRQRKKTLQKRNLNSKKENNDKSAQDKPNQKTEERYKKIEQFYQAIIHKDYTKHEINEYYIRRNELLSYYYSQNIKHKVETYKDKLIPKIKISRSLIDQFRYTAKKTSKYFNKRMEVAGICSGTESSNTLILNRYHICYNQVANEVAFSINGGGYNNTCLDIKKENIQNIAMAHSHNTMNCFHSPTDNFEIIKNAKSSTKPIPLNIDNLTHHGKSIQAYYTISIVFNEKIGWWKEGTPEYKPYIHAAICYPKLTPEGLKNTEVIHFKYSLEEYLNDGHAKLSDLKRLNKEIKGRVQYKANLDELIRKAA
jgi:hypothetical protein